MPNKPPNFDSLNLPKSVQDTIEQLVDRRVQEIQDRQKAQKQVKNRAAKAKGREGKVSVSFLVPLSLHRDYKKACGGHGRLTNSLIEHMERVVSEGRGVVAVDRKKEWE